MTHIIDHEYLRRGLPVSAPGRVLIAEVLAALITSGQVQVDRHADWIDFVGLPGDADAVAVRVHVPTSTNAQVARWLGVPTDLLHSDTDHRSR